MSKKGKREIRKNSSLDTEVGISLKKDKSLIDVTDVIKKSDNVENKFTDLDHMALYKEIIKSKEDLINSKDIIIDELNKRMILLEEKIELLLSKNEYENGMKLYSESVKVNVENKYTSKEKSNLRIDTISNANILTIKPNKIQESKITRQELGKLINPAKLNVDIKKIEDLRDGAIKIKCNSREEVNKIQKEVENNLGLEYLTKIQEKRKPRIKLVGLENIMTEDLLKRDILEKNEGLINADIKIVTIKKMKTKYMSIIELDAKNFKIIMEKGFLFIGFSVCSVYEHIDILRCFKCTGYHHTNRTCTRQEVCLKCGRQDHMANECKTIKENIICPNCCEENVKLNCGYLINHPPFDNQCEVYKLNYEKAKRKIDYHISE